MFMIINISFILGMNRKSFTIYRLGKTLEMTTEVGM